MTPSCLNRPRENKILLALTGQGKTKQNPPCLNRPRENKQNPPCLNRPRENTTKSSSPQPAEGKQSKISSLPQPAKGKQSKICSRGSSELIGPDRVSTSSRPPAKSGPKFACTSVASSPGSEQCANFPPSTLQRLLQGSNEPSASAKVGKLKVPRVVPSVSLLPGDPWTVRTFRVIGEHQGFGPVVSGTALGCSPFVTKHCFAG